MFFQREEMPSFTPYKRNQSRNCDISYLLQVSKDKKKKNSLIYCLCGFEEAGGVSTVAQR